MPDEMRLDENSRVILDPQPPDHRHPQAIQACPLCDTEGIRGGFPCHHTDHAAAAKRGKAACIAQLKAKRTPTDTTQPETHPQ
ncbi:Uncharacterised protein [Mycolicibacterium vanbaalenii]|uniref:Uncharacterized protein n=1 Tax=Mycolicibacterium vanbaalenii TaxID=110539 RepID=A0A5S9R732_MYCVN|nr:hypothetical protein [Mycolicibacterium vanbaalenii]CAA0129308.1 Uncharacterised protein [Mycolicibacterium vanbaalenii]